MIRTWLLSLEYVAMRQANQLIYFFQKIPWIGKKIPDRLYAAQDKAFWYGAAGILRQLYNLLTKLFYIGVMLGLPFLAYLEFHKLTPSPELLVTVGFYLFFMFNLIGASVARPVLLDTRELQDYEMVKLARMDEKQFFLTRILISLLHHSLVLTIALGLTSIFLPLTLMDLLMLFIAHGSVRLLSEAVQLYLFDRFGWDLHRQAWRVISIMLSLVVITGAGLVLLPSLTWARMITSPYFSLIMLVLAGISIHYLWRSQAYVKLSNNRINLIKILETMSLEINIKKAPGIIDDDDVRLDIPEAKLAGRTGYDYLHQLFFERYGPVLMRGMRLRIFIYLAVSGLAIAVTMLFFRSQVQLRFEAINASLIRFSFYFFYFFGSSGERFTKMLFLNMDYQLLPYSFYREPQAVTAILKLRFKKLLQLSFIPTIVLVIGYVSWGLLATGTQFWQQILLVSGIFLSLGLFFNLHHLIIYQTFQPFNQDLDVKHPVVKMINFIIYMLTIALWRTQDVPSWIYQIALAAMIVYVIAGILLMRKLAPKNFKLKH